MKKIILLALVFSISFISFTEAQTKPIQKETFQATYDGAKTLVSSKAFKYVGEVVFENRKRERLDAQTNTIIVNQGSSTGNLSALNSKSSLKAEGKISNYKVNFNDDLQTIHVEFDVNKMKVLIDIKPNGNAFLTVEGAVNKITQRGKLQSI